MQELIRAYVPEAEHLTYTEAAALAKERDAEAAEELKEAAERLAESCEDAGCQPVR